MKALSARTARANLYKLIEETASSHEPICIIATRGNAVLLSEEDCRAVNETLYLLSFPGMRDSIKEGLATPLEECSEEPGW
jgi:antitoxin YefM